MFTKRTKVSLNGVCPRRKSIDLLSPEVISTSPITPTNLDAASGRNRTSWLLSARTSSAGSSLSPDASVSGCQNGDSVASSPSSIPDTGRHLPQWRRKGTGLRFELDALGDGLRRAGASLRGSMECLLNNCSPASSSPELERRRIRVEQVKDSGKSSGGGGGRNGRRLIAGDDDDDWSYDQPDHNFSSSLTLNSIQDGVFSAQIPMESIPLGDITIRIRNYKLEVIIQKRDTIVNNVDRTSTFSNFGRLDDAHRISRPYYCGSIDVPIYVDTTTLHFRLDLDSDMLCIEGLMKGYFDRKLQKSMNDLRVQQQSTTTAGEHLQRRTKTSGLQGRVAHRGGLTGSNETEAERSAPDGQLRSLAGFARHNWMNRFRQRAYTH